MSPAHVDDDGDADDDDDDGDDVDDGQWHIWDISAAMRIYI